MWESLSKAGRKSVRETPVHEYILQADVSIHTEKDRLLWRFTIPMTRNRLRNIHRP